MLQTYEQDIGGFPKKMVEEQDRYVESDKPLDQHRFQGWHYHSETKKYYRFDDLPPYENQ